MKKQIETVDHYPTAFQWIPLQDNPAYGNEECLMIVKSEKNDHAIVLHVQPVEDAHKDDSVTSIATFWKHDKAIEYCGFLNRA